MLKKLFSEQFKTDNNQKREVQSHPIKETAKQNGTSNSLRIDPSKLGQGEPSDEVTLVKNIDVKVKKGRYMRYFFFGVFSDDCLHSAMIRRSFGCLLCPHGHKSGRHHFSLNFFFSTPE